MHLSNHIHVAQAGYAYYECTVDNLVSTEFGEMSPTCKLAIRFLSFIRRYLLVYLFPVDLTSF